MIMQQAFCVELWFAGVVWYRVKIVSHMKLLTTWSMDYIVLFFFFLFFFLVL